MRKFKIVWATGAPSVFGAERVVEAERIVDASDGKWVDFQVQSKTVLRVRSSDVALVELLSET